MWEAGARVYRWPDERIPFYLRERRARRDRVMREARHIYPFLCEPYWVLHAHMTYSFHNVTFLAGARALRCGVQSGHSGGPG